MRELGKEYKKNKSGFTLIELSLSLVFIGILSLAVAYVINDTIGAYRRGITLSQINMTGIDLVDDMRRIIQESPIRAPVDKCSDYSDMNEKSKCENDRASRFMYVVKRDNIRVNGEDLEDIPIYGAFCTGRYSYIWNSGYLFALGKEGENKMAKLQYGEDKSTEGPFRLLRIKDASRSVCGPKDKEKYADNINNNFSVDSSRNDADPVDLLKSDESNGGLALYNLYVPMPARDEADSSALYSVSFILGTVQGGINIKKSGGFCATSGEYENFDYCAINKFNFAVLATGGL